MLDRKEQKAAYIELINDAAKDCKDIDLLDLVYKLLITDGAEPTVKKKPEPKPKPAPESYDPEKYRAEITAQLETCQDGYSMAVISGFVKEFLGGAKRG